MQLIVIVNHEQIGVVMFKNYLLHWGKSFFCCCNFEKKWENLGKNTKFSRNFLTIFPGVCLYSLVYFIYLNTEQITKINYTMKKKSEDIEITDKVVPKLESTFLHYNRLLQQDATACTVTPVTYYTYQI